MAEQVPTKPKKQLVTLPQEMFDHVTSHLKKKELCNLRLVSRETEKMVLETYKRECFYTKTILPCNETSLANALDVAKHPVYGPLIRKIRVYVNGFLLRNKDEYEHRLPYLSSLLSKFFAYLDSKAQGSRDIGIEFCGAPEDAQFILPENVDHLSSCMCCDETLKNVLVALHGTNLQIRELTLNGDDGVAFQGLKAGDYFLGAEFLLPRWETIKNLTLTFWCGFTDDELNMVHDCLWYPKGLKFLSLTYIYNDNHGYTGCEHRKDLEYDDNLIRDLLHPPVKFEELDEIYLNGLTIEIAHLIEFVDLQPRLRYLTLDCCLLNGHEQYVTGEEKLSQVLERLTGIEEIEIQ